MIDAAVLATFAAYLLAMFAIGLWAWRRTRNLSEYILGGRRLGRWVTALSAGASDMSGWLLMGLPGYAYAAGLESLWIAAGLFLGTWANWRWVAPPLRRRSFELGDAITLPEYFERRFDDRSRLLRWVAALLILIFFTFYAGSGLVAGGKLFEAVFGLEYHQAVAAGAAVVVLYTLLGGFLAVSWTDAVQAALMFLALVAVPAAALLELGPGFGLAAAATPLLDPFTTAAGEPLGGLAILSLLGWGLGYFGQPHILARFMAIESPAALPAARRIALAWVGVSLAAAVLVGLSGIGLLSAGELADAEKVFIELTRLLFHPLFAGVCLAAILAAIMSTADSQLLVASSALSEDFYKSWLRPGASERELVWVGRLAVTAIALLAFVLALEPESGVLELVAYAWAGFGAAFGPALLLSLHWERMTRDGALAGMVTGGVTVMVWRPLEGGWFDLYEIIPGFLLSLAAIVVVSRFARRQP